MNLLCTNAHPSHSLCRNTHPSHSLCRTTHPSHSLCTNRPTHPSPSLYSNTHPSHVPILTHHMYQYPSIPCTNTHPSRGTHSMYSVPIPTHPIHYVPTRVKKLLSNRFIMGLFFLNSAESNSVGQRKVLMLILWHGKSRLQRR